jgi:hypothetical protein
LIANTALVAVMLCYLHQCTYEIVNQASFPYKNNLFELTKLITMIVSWKTGDILFMHASIVRGEHTEELIKWPM